MRFLRFDDKVLRTKESQKNPIGKIEAIFNCVVEKSRQMFVPSKYMTIDESMIGYRGRVKFKMFCKAKPDKYGMKVSF